MRILKRIFVFALFAFAAVLAFGAIKVSAADTEYSYTFEAKQFTANGSVDLGGVSWTIAGDGNYWGYDNTKGQQLGSGNAPYKSLTVSTNGISGTIKSITINTSGASKISGSFTVSVGGTQYGAATTLTTTATPYTFEGTSEGEIVFSYTQTSSKAIYIKSIEVTYELSANQTQLEAPSNITLNGNTLTWDAVSGATGYKVSLDTTVVAENAQGTTLDLSTLLTNVSYGTYTISILALGDGATTLNSQAGICATEYLYKYTFEYNTTFIYKNYEELLPLAPNDNTESTKEYYAKVYINAVTNTTYGNCDVIDENGDTFVIWGLYDSTGATRYDALDAAIKPKAGDEIVVRGIIQNFNGVTFEIKNAKLLQLNGEKLADEIAVGVQTADAGEGNKHVRLVGGLNIDYEEITSLSFTITDANDAQKTTTITVSNVFGTLTANGTAGVAEITAASQGFESLFALTITNIPAGTTLKVTATYTTAEGTYTSAVKTVEVPAAQ